MSSKKRCRLVIISWPRLIVADLQGYHPARYRERGNVGLALNGLFFGSGRLQMPTANLMQAYCGLSVRSFGRGSELLVTLFRHTVNQTKPLAIT